MANESTKIEVDGVGIVTLNHSDKAKHISIRIKSEEVILVVPKYGRVNDAIAFLLKKKNWVENALRRSNLKGVNSKPTLFNEETHFESLTFSLQIKRYEGAKFLVSLKDGILDILCPKTVEIETDNVQKLIKTILVRTLRKEAQRVLPTRLKELSQIHGLEFQNCTIRETRTRWGSCNQKKEINLNLYLMCLPPHLIDYVLIHELCHTKEMNHGPKFWALVEKFTGKPHSFYRKEMKRYHPGL